MNLFELVNIFENVYIIQICEPFLKSSTYCELTNIYTIPQTFGNCEHFSIPVSIVFELAIIV